MKRFEDIKESGLLELYVLGNTSVSETAEIESLAREHEEIRVEIELISKALEAYAEAHAVKPDVTIKPFLMATIDYMERLEAGELPAFPPQLNERSKLIDYAEWLSRTDMVLPDDPEDMFAKIIGYTAEATTAIVWIKEMAPMEVHTDEYEKFLIVEGTCDITIDEEVHHLKPGSFLSIPLHKNHFVKVTSDIPCKVILQRIAA